MLDDVVQAGLSSRLFVAPQRCAPRSIEFRKPDQFFGPRPQYSSFWRAAAARSVCLVDVARRVPECPRFADVFIRDWATLVGMKKTPRNGAIPRGWRLPNLTRLPPQMAPERRVLMYKSMHEAHPCKNTSIQACLLSYARGMMRGPDLAQS